MPGILELHVCLARSLTANRIATKSHTHVRVIITRRPVQYGGFPASTLSLRKANVCTLGLLKLHVCLARSPTAARIATKFHTHVRVIIPRRPIQFGGFPASSLSSRKANVCWLDAAQLHVCLARSTTTAPTATKLHPPVPYIISRRLMQYERILASSLSPREANVSGRIT